MKEKDDLSMKRKPLVFVPDQIIGKGLKADPNNIAQEYNGYFPIIYAK